MAGRGRGQLLLDAIKRAKEAEAEAASSYESGASRGAVPPPSTSSGTSTPASKLSSMMREKASISTDSGRVTELRTSGSTPDVTLAYGPPKPTPKIVREGALSVPVLQVG